MNPNQHELLSFANQQDEVRSWLGQIGSRLGVPHLLVNKAVVANPRVVRGAEIPTGCSWNRLRIACC
jgi:hypothetical protein